MPIPIQLSIDGEMFENRAFTLLLSLKKPSQKS